MVIGVLQESLLSLVIFQNDSVQPIVRETVFWLCEELDIVHLLEKLGIGSCSGTFVSHIFIQVL